MELNWRLPNKDELNAMYENLHKKGLGGFAGYYYWSSSEYNADLAWLQYFFNGYQNNINKNYDTRVRGVRAFSSAFTNLQLGDITDTGIIFWADGLGNYKECKFEDEPGTYTWEQAMDLFSGKEKSELTDEELDSMLPPLPPEKPKQYVVIVNGKGGFTKIHDDYDIALAEAKRLAEKEKEVTYVLEIKAKLSVDIKVEEY
jgi:hypothetical protein